MNDIEYFNKARKNYFYFYDYEYDGNHPSEVNIDPIPDGYELVDSGTYITKDDKIKAYNVHEERWFDADIMGVYPCIPFNINTFYCICDCEPDETKYPLTFKDLEKRLKENKTMWILLYPDTSRMEYFILDSIDKNTGNTLYEMYDEYDAHWLDGDPLYKNTK